MRVSDVDILIVPGLEGASEQHWQSRWEAKLSTASRVAPPAADPHDAKAWIAAVADAVSRAERPPVIVAHALGVAAAVAAAPLFRRPAAGAFFVAPTDLGDGASGFEAYSREPLPFPSIVVASRGAPDHSFDAIEDVAAAWGSLFVDAGESGGLDEASGHGPWPEGLLTFGKFLSRLPAP
ncbi:serine hydrolase family protein [Aureimonas flava]|uniref:Serine hydrolase family protein n=1 Tax=Aureimonas flava TaxID=2320271 RepID=A0A3A1WSS2_9HYPH|nr:alpha/beta hydrolase [Aureimonas flava]RIY03631.1 serine hydrolase family protein [Aureimonas flava]